jgi:hypothetical protein
MLACYKEKPPVEALSRTPAAHLLAIAFRLVQNSVQMREPAFSREEMNGVLAKLA